MRKSYSEAQVLALWQRPDKGHSLVLQPEIKVEIWFSHHYWVHSFIHTFNKLLLSTSLVKGIKDKMEQKIKSLPCEVSFLQREKTIGQKNE